MRWLLVFLATALANPGAAQHWITKEACTVETPALAPVLFEPLGLDAAREAAARSPNGLGKFWRIEAPNGAVSHLWGTVHSSEPRLLDLPEIVVETIVTSSVLMVEIDPRHTSRREIEIANSIDSWFIDPRAPSAAASNHIDPQILEWIRSRTHSIGWSREAADVLSLGGISELLLLDPCEDFNGYTYPIQDGRIQMLADIAGVKIVPLEDQNRFLSHLSQPDNRELAIAVVELFGSGLDPDLYAERVSAGHYLYQRGEMGLWLQLDLAWVTRVLGPERGPEALTLADRWILDERNADFVRAAAPHLQDGGAFIAVGAAHIPGAQGMVELLRAEGYAVTRIPLDGEAEQ